MQTPSAFRPVTQQTRSYYTIMVSANEDPVNNSLEKVLLPPKKLSAAQPTNLRTKAVKKIDRNWTLNSTKYVMLKYRHWQLVHRRSVTFVDLLNSMSNDLQKYFYLKKSPSQIKDKINNTKAGYISLLDTIKTEKTGEASVSSNTSSKKIPNDVFFFVDRFYNAQRSVFAEDVVAEIDITLKDEKQKLHLMIH
ncbi:hypothetical protein EIN_252170 [Entamoeba invadens IP1]|uniref:Uncharacterized protein n=1 Tax=Entamoeba invadens IP1 TaxID=370355 RepID=A0A0A1UEX4_ENTIV|nr:hypothetical protein EIN_252170 [Entamoeba invadens IP1]ELP95013.1 hypothetical protein EIN_252170 [Entamoeba invadens IP1]|eukprot:XP_004261784.1 hypothetical protein EIN_252170 [Entamoeba invadens IP1]